MEESNEEYCKIYLAENKGSNTKLIDNLLYYKNRLWIPNSDELQIWITQEEHDSKVTGYFEQETIIELLFQNILYPNITKYIIDYVQICSDCQMNKST
jgi:hypothetical protein